MPVAENCITSLPSYTANGNVFLLSTFCCLLNISCYFSLFSQEKIRSLRTWLLASWAAHECIPVQEHWNWRPNKSIHFFSCLHYCTIIPLLNVSIHKYLNKRVYFWLRVLLHEYVSWFVFVFFFFYVRVMHLEPQRGGERCLGKCWGCAIAFSASPV